MKRVLFICGLLLYTSFARAQVIFKTVVPEQPVAIGESFQVQYIMDEAEKGNGFKAPLFSNFRFVAGPSVYHGSAYSSTGSRQVTNTVYTLEAIKTGKFIIPGASITVNGILVKSNNAIVEVISKEEAQRRRNESLANSPYFLRPGENAVNKIKKNLFLKVEVDKRNCYVGEPVLATYKLYSRLESQSDIIKNPGFYGFSVYDMINLSDRFVTTEKINGKDYDVHTIRKVQLFPLRAGNFLIDPMEIKNRVEFSRSVVNKKTEQEIVEGVLNNSTETKPDKNTLVFETTMQTAPVNIRAKELPVFNKPDSFNGAVGNFSILAKLNRDILARNEEGLFDLVVKGHGNFIQLSAPSIAWPAGLEGFEPSLEDSLNKTTSPTMGSRIFHYPFVSARAGKYLIPALEFTFFNPDSGTYRTIKTKEQYITVSNKQIAQKTQPGAVQKNAVANKSNRWKAGLIILTSVIAFLSLYIFFKKRKTISPTAKAEIKSSAISIDALLAPAAMYIQADEKSFYSALHLVVWAFLNTHFGLSGSDINKETLSVVMKGKGIEQEQINKIIQVLKHCEAGRFTNANMLEDKSFLLQEVKKMLSKIEEALL